MPSYNIVAVNGVQNIVTKSAALLSHDIAISHPQPILGTIVIKGRKSGSDVYEDIPGGIFDLAALDTAQFVGSVAEYEVTITGLTGIHSITLTDTVSQG